MHTCTHTHTHIFSLLSCVMINSDSQIQATGFFSFPSFLTTGKANLFIHLWSNPDLCSMFTKGDFVPRNKPQPQVTKITAFWALA